MKKILASFSAFNENAFNTLLFLTSTNISYILIIACTAAFVFLYLKDELIMSVREEQNIL